MLFRNSRRNTLHDLSLAVADRRARVCFAPSCPPMCAHWDRVLVRLLSRICSVVNVCPQTLQRHPGDAACAIPGTGC